MSPTVTGGPPPITPVAHDTDLLPGDWESLAQQASSSEREGPDPPAKHLHVIRTGPPTPSSPWPSPVLAAQHGMSWELVDTECVLTSWKKQTLLK